MGEMVEVLEASIPPAVDTTLNKELDEANVVPLGLEAGVAAVETTLNKELDEANVVPPGLEAGVAAVVEAALNIKADEAIVVPFEPPLLQPGA